VLCSFVVRFDIRDEASDAMRSSLPLLLAASGFALSFDQLPQTGRPLAWIPAPAVRDCMYEVLGGAET